MIRPLAASGYVAVIVAANIVTNVFGLIPAGFGLVTAAGTVFAGLALLLRDVVQDAAGRWVALALIAVGATLSALLSTPALAVASAAAFLISELVDLAVYTPLRARGWNLRAKAASNLISAPIDTVVFLSLAGFGLATPIVAGQLVGKLLYATAIPLLLRLAVRQLRATSAVTA
jgi:uncharacterized PurR-regulated membrane protein YhhQ (DUF165 family)